MHSLFGFESDAFHRSSDWEDLERVQRERNQKDIENEMKSRMGNLDVPEFWVDAEEELSF